MYVCSELSHETGVLYDGGVLTAAEQRVDMLINNAGVLRTSRAVTTDGFEMHLGVNYLG